VQKKDDGTHAILPVATPSKSAMDHAGMPGMLLRHSRGKTRRDGPRAAWMQPDFAVDERGRLHSAPGLVDVVVSRGQACIRGPCRNRGDHQQWVRNRKTPDRLKRLFKSGFDKPVHADSRRVSESGARCNDLDHRWHRGEL
jgi:hypothetical protein